jgi:hypothetical protein
VLDAGNKLICSRHLIRVAHVLLIADMSVNSNREQGTICIDDHASLIKGYPLIPLNVLLREHFYFYLGGNRGS